MTPLVESSKTIGLSPTKRETSSDRRQFKIQLADSSILDQDHISSPSPTSNSIESTSPVKSTKKKKNSEHHISRHDDASSKGLLASPIQKTLNHPHFGPLKVSHNQLQQPFRFPKQTSDPDLFHTKSIIEAGVTDLDAMGKSLSFAFLRRHFESKSTPVVAFPGSDSHTSPSSEELKSRTELQQDLKSYFSSLSVARLTRKGSNAWIQHMLKMIDLPTYQKQLMKSGKDVPAAGKELLTSDAMADQTLSSIISNATQAFSRKHSSPDVVYDLIIKQLAEHIAEDCATTLTHSEFVLYYRDMVGNFPLMIQARKINDPQTTIPRAEFTQLQVLSMSFMS